MIDTGAGGGGIRGNVANLLLDTWHSILPNQLQMQLRISIMMMMLTDFTIFCWSFFALLINLCDIDSSRLTSSSSSSKVSKVSKESDSHSCRRSSSYCSHLLQQLRCQCSRAHLRFLWPKVFGRFWARLPFLWSNIVEHWLKSDPTDSCSIAVAQMLATLPVVRCWGTSYYKCARQKDWLPMIASFITIVGLEALVKDRSHPCDHLLVAFFNANFQLNFPCFSQNQPE